MVVVIRKNIGELLWMIRTDEDFGANGLVGLAAMGGNFIL